MEKLLFENLGLSKEIMQAVSDLGFEQASPIQSEAIPQLMAGKDLTGQSQTGTGKTAAFGIPIIEKIDIKNKSIQALILCPTRELCVQVAEEFIKLAKYKKGVSIAPVYGGQSIEIQIRSIARGAQIIIGTPGRVMDHIERRTIKLDNLKIVVLDEADEMLDMGFRDDINFILGKTPTERQTVMFSATLAKNIIDLMKKYQRDPHTIKIAHHELTMPKIEQIYYEVRRTDKLEVLTRLLDIHNIKIGIIFCNTKRQVDELTAHLQARGYSAAYLHGDLKQNMRDRVMKQFREGAVNVLVATDIAGRGIDVDNVEAVFNFELPQDEEDYVHRIGRTGRAGKTGIAISLVSGNDLFKLRLIQKYSNVKIKPQNVPSFDDIQEIKSKTLFLKLKEILEKKDLKKYKTLIEQMIDDERTVLDIAAALLCNTLGVEEKEIKKIEKDNFGGRPSGDRAYGRDSGREHGRPTRQYTPNAQGGDERLFINVGRAQRIGPKDILGAIANEANIPGSAIGQIDIYDNYTFVNIDKKFVAKVLEKMSGASIRGARINLEVADKR